MKRIYSQNLFLTPGFWTACGQAFIACLPILNDFDRTGRMTWVMGATMLASAAMAVAAVIDRLHGNDTVIYTPDGLPGLSSSEAKNLARTQSDAIASHIPRHFPKATDNEEFWREED